MCSSNVSLYELVLFFCTYFYLNEKMCSVSTMKAQSMQMSSFIEDLMNFMKAIVELSYLGYSLLLIRFY